MKVTFLGTSHGVPEPHRRCSSTLIEVNNNYYIIDMGCQTIDDLVTLGVSQDAVKAIFFTHLHGDHINGLVSYVDLLSWYYKTPDPEIFLPKIDIVEPLERFVTVSEGSVRKLRYTVTEPGVIYDDGVVKVSANTTGHCDKAYGFVVQTEGKTLVFSGDLGNPATDIPMIKDPDMIVVEGAHINALNYKEIFEAREVRNAYFNHYAPWNVPNIEELKKQMPDVNITATTDYMEVTL